KRSQQRKSQGIDGARETDTITPSMMAAAIALVHLGACMHMIGYRRLAAAAAVFTAFITAPSYAAEPVLRVGKAQPESIAFTPVDVGHRLGIFKKHGIDVAIMAFGGGAKLHQGIVAGSVDIGLGSGPDLPFIVKGAPERAVAVTVNAPTYTVLMVKPESPIKSPADVKGKSVLVGSEKSLTA